MVTVIRIISSLPEKDGGGGESLSLSLFPSFLETSEVFVFVAASTFSVSSWGQKEKC